MIRARRVLLCLLAAGLARAEDIEPALEFVHADCVIGVAYSPDGVTAASCDNAHLIRIWSTISGRELVTLAGHRGHVATIRFTPDGRHLLSGSYDKTVRMWDVATGREIWCSHAPDSTVYKVRIAPDGSHFATATTSEVIIWEMETRRPVRRLVGADPCAFSPDGRRLAAELNGRSIAVYQLPSGRLVRCITPEGGRSISSLVFTRDGRRIVAGLRNGDVVLHDIAGGDCVRRMIGHTESARGLAISPDGRLLASGSWDTSIRVWELVSGSELMRLTGHEDYVLSLAFSPDGSRLLSGARDSRAILWDLDAWQRGLAEPEPDRAGSFAGPTSGGISPPAGGGFERRWADLANRDARVAFAAIWAFVGAGDRAVAFLAARPEFGPVASASPEAIAGIVRDLEGSAVARDRARRRLRRLGLAAEAALVTAGRESDSPELRRAAARLLDGFSPPDNWEPGDLRHVRAVQVLERIGTPAARRLLERLARDLKPCVAREARFALRRMVEG